MANIEAVGFDMDAPLAQYNEAFDMLAFEGAKDKLIDMGYPEKLFVPLNSIRCSTRGLVIDKRRGKYPQDGCHKYVRRAYHGTGDSVVKEKRSTFDAGATPTLVGNDYVNVDSLGSSTRRYSRNS